MTRRATNETARRPITKTAVHLRVKAAAGPPEVDPGPLTREQVRSIERSLRDFDDPTRYFLVSDFGAGFKLVRCMTRMKSGKRVPVLTPSKARPTERGGTRSRRTRG